MHELILALDVPDGAAAFRTLAGLDGVRSVKVGSILMAREGPRLVEDLVTRGLSVFLDLKWHDIPNTVSGAVRAAQRVGVRMATVHTLGGRDMMAAAAEAAGDEMALIGVTVLTSHSPASYGAATGRAEVDLVREALRLAGTAMEAGLAGVVCSPRETGAIRKALGADATIVVPGIRQSGDPADDQQRTATAREARQAGASHLVIGRTVLQAADPAATWASLVEEIA